MPVLNFLSGYKTYLAAAGLVGFAVYHVSQGDYPSAWANIVAAFGLFGVRQAIAGVQSEQVATRLDVASHTAVVQQALDAARAAKP